MVQTIEDEGFDRVSSNNLTFFTNSEGQKLEDRFKSVLKDVRYFDILVGYFRTSGFYRLYKEFENIEKIRILVGLNTDNKTIEVIQNAQNFKSENDTKEILSSQIIDEIYKSDDDYNTDFGIKKFIEFIRSGKLEIKAHPSNNIHAKVYISHFKPEDRDLGRVITGSSNFSQNGLDAQYEFNVELTSPADYKYATKHFEHLWAEAVDLSQTYIDTVEHKTHLTDEITPYELYLKFLYEYYKERLELKSETQNTALPEGFLDLKYQKDAVCQLAQIVKEYDGAFLSDVVGLGKTYIATMYMMNLAGQKLVICPPHIKDNWENVIQEFQVGGAKVCSLGNLDKILADKPERYQYVFVDEAHRFRNRNTEQYEMLHRICAGKKVILITATPLNNSINDFQALLMLFLSPTRCLLPGIPNLNAFFTNINKPINKIDKKNKSEEYLQEVKEASKIIRNKILNHLMVRRTRTEIKDSYEEDIKKQGLFFPEVETPHRIAYKFDGKTNLIFEKTIEKLKEFKFARYQNNLKEAFRGKKSPMYQDQNLIGFLKTMLVKRLESSRYAFLQTISRFISSYKFFIEMYNNNTICLNSNLDGTSLNEDNVDSFFEELEKRNDAVIYTKEQFQPDFIDNLNDDLEVLEWIYDAWKNVTTDFKKDEFVETLKTNTILNNSKIIIFTESTETGVDLYNTLEKKYKAEVLMYSSNICRYKGYSVSPKLAKELIHKNYDPKNSNATDEIRILITTDVLAESINLHRSNVIVNYDLPWNPTKVLQRVGRINRVGSKFKKIHIFNIFPTNISDSELGLVDNIKSKIQAFHEALGEDAKYLSEDEEITNHKLFATDFYNKISNTDIFNNDSEDEFSHLKYIRILEDLRDNDPTYFNHIKYLPRKARTTRTLSNIKNEKLITFFRKDNHNAIYLTNGDFCNEISIDEAMPYFECDKNCVKQSLNPNFYNLLAINKAEFNNALFREIVDSENKSQSGTSHKIVIERIKFILQEHRHNKVAFTDNEEEFLKQTLDLYEQGAILNRTSNDIKKELQNVIDCRKSYEIIKHYIPEEYFNNKRKTKKDIENCKQGIILSEMFTLI